MYFEQSYPILLICFNYHELVGEPNKCKKCELDISGSDNPVNTVVVVVVVAVVVVVMVVAVVVCGGGGSSSRYSEGFHNGP
jgi:hypothetical protein